MKLQLKRSGQPVFAPNWHPNFRNTQLLPDLKVVRTTFFINVSCIAIATAVLMSAGYREYQAFDYRSKISSARNRIEELKVQNDALLAQNKEFMDGVRKFEEAQEFMASRISGTKMLSAVAASLPDLVELRAINYEKAQLTLRGVIKLDSETASQKASAYLDALRADAFIGTAFPDISLTNLMRDTGSQGMTFEILLKQAEQKDSRKPARTNR